MSTPPSPSAGVDDGSSGHDGRPRPHGDVHPPQLAFAVCRIAEAASVADGTLAKRLQRVGHSLGRASGREIGRAALGAVREVGAVLRSLPGESGEHPLVAPLASAIKALAPLCEDDDTGGGTVDDGGRAPQPPREDGFGLPAVGRTVEASGIRPARGDGGAWRGAEPPSDRRASPRVPIRAEVGLDTETHFYEGFTEDLSTGGLFVATYDLLPRGTRVTVSLVLPDGCAIEAAGRVEWVRDPADRSTSPGLGVRFEALTPDDERSIRGFLEAREPFFYDV